MTYSEPSPPPPGAPATDIAVYGCEMDEAALFRAMAPRFGARPIITEAPVSESNAALARGVRCVSVSHRARVPNAALRALAGLGVAYLSTRSIGYDHVDVAYAERVGVTVENVAYSPDGVADYTVMLMLMALRHAKSTVLRAEAHDYRVSGLRGRELRDLTVGVVGAGRIGTAVVERLRGFGCRILACDRRPGPDRVPLPELLRRSDIVTLHTPLNAATRHLLDRGRIELMRPGALVVNTGRGPLIDTEALLRALDEGRLGGAALDVVEGEEGVFYADRRSDPVANKALLRLQELPNVVISPHTAYYTDRALSDTVADSIVNCTTFEREHPHG